jgi:methyl coenzyme M reductase beta subunit
VDYFLFLFSLAVSFFLRGSCFRAMLIHTGCGKAFFSYACWGDGGGAQNGEEVARGKSRRAGAIPCLWAGVCVCAGAI